MAKRRPSGREVDEEERHAPKDSGPPRPVRMRDVWLRHPAGKR